MDLNSNLEKIKKECKKLYDLRDSSTAYYDKVDDISERVYELRLHDIIDPSSLSASLLWRFQKNISTMSRDEFNNYIEDCLELGQYNFYFHLTEPEGFPDDYKIGHGVLMSYKLLPEPVKAVATDLSEGKIPEHQPHKDIIEKLSNPDRWKVPIPIVRSRPPIVQALCKRIERWHEKQIKKKSSRRTKIRPIRGPKRKKGPLDVFLSK